MSDDASVLREMVGDTLGRFALGDPRVTEDELIEVVDLDLTLDAQTIEGRRLRAFLTTGKYRDELAEARWVA